MAIFRRFPTTFGRFSKILKKLSEVRRPYERFGTFLKRLPKIAGIYSQIIVVLHVFNNGLFLGWKSLKNTAAYSEKYVHYIVAWTH